MSLCHYVIMSSCHVTKSLSHHSLVFNIATNWLTDRQTTISRAFRYASQTNIKQASVSASVLIIHKSTYLDTIDTNSLQQFRSHISVPYLIMRTLCYTYLFTCDIFCIIWEAKALCRLPVDILVNHILLQRLVFNVCRDDLQFTPHNCYTSQSHHRRFSYLSSILQRF